MNRESLFAWVEPGRCALLVIDVQNDFCHVEGALGRRGYDLSMNPEMVPRLLRLIQEAKEASIPVLYIRLARKTEGEWPAMDRLFRAQFGEDYIRVAVEGTWGVDYYGGLHPEPGDIVITKPRYGAFAETELEAVLRGLGVQSLILTGVATNVCVESTAREGFMRDYDVVVVSDCCASVSRARHEATLENIALHFGWVATAEEVAKAWAGTGVSSRRGEKAPA